MRSHVGAAIPQLVTYVPFCSGGCPSPHPFAPSRRRAHHRLARQAATSAFAPTLSFVGRRRPTTAPFIRQGGFIRRTLEQRRQRRERRRIRLGRDELTFDLRETSGLRSILAKVGRDLCEPPRKGRANSYARTAERKVESACFASNNADSARRRCYNFRVRFSYDVDS